MNKNAQKTNKHKSDKKIIPHATKNRKINNTQKPKTTKKDKKKITGKNKRQQ